jgi:uncharacterized repeat protein (TIGR02543 family)
MRRREFFRRSGTVLFLPLLGAARTRGTTSAPVLNDIFSIKGIPDDPYYLQDDHHSGLDALLYLMGSAGLKFFRTAGTSPLGGPSGLIAAGDVVLIKVNAQWKHRGCTNSDLVRGLVRRILEHPETFTGEVVLVENGQGRGSLRCDNWAAYGTRTTNANANDPAQSFQLLVDRVFRDPRVSAVLLDPIRARFIADDDHATDGYRRFENVSYPCFTTPRGHRVELKEGTWSEGAWHPNLKLINVPVLKHHDIGGSEITASLKLVYGLVSMADGMSSFRHYGGLGETCGTMMAEVRTPVLNILDAVWVSHGALKGYPEEATRRLNRVAASQDPVALDRWAAQDILYPIDRNSRHHPDHPNIRAWLTAARDTINARGGLADPGSGIVVGRVTDRADEVRVLAGKAYTAGQRLLTLAAGEGGTTDPAPGVHVVARDSRVRITAVPKPGYGFAGWTGDAEGNSNPLTLAMDGNRTVAAEFKPHIRVPREPRPERQPESRPRPPSA